MCIDFLQSRTILVYVSHTDEVSASFAANNSQLKMRVASAPKPQNDLGKNRTEVRTVSQGGVLRDMNTWNNNAGNKNIVGIDNDSTAGKWESEVEHS